MQHKGVDIKRIRVTRPKADGAASFEDSGHLWAVSYADFLMVLLSFFVIFFSVNKNKRDGIIQKIMLGVHTMGTGTNSPGPTSGSQQGFMGTESSSGSAEKESTTKETTAELRAPNCLSESMQKAFNSRLKITKMSEDKIILDLPDDSYKKGSIEMNADAKKIFNQLLEQVLPFKKEIRVGVIGHTDETPFAHSQGRALENNSDLSVVRASKALAIAVSKGIAYEQIYAQGSASNIRNARSLTIVIEAKKQDKEL